MQLGKSEQIRRFDEIVAPHISAAYNLARWLLRNESDAEDVVQESCLRAFRYLDGFRGGNPRAWLLSIVRNTSYSWMEQHNDRNRGTLAEAEEKADGQGQERALHDLLDGQLLRHEMESLPVEFREVIVLCDLEGFSYKEIAEMTNVPIGTVMSRLARGRKQLQRKIGTQQRRTHEPQ